MDFLDKLEEAVGNEYLINQPDFSSEIHQNCKLQANTTMIVSITNDSQPNSNKIVSVQSIDA